MCVAKSLCCSPDTITTLLSGYTPIQNVFGIKKIKIKLKKTQWKFICISWLCLSKTRCSGYLFLSNRPQKPWLTDIYLAQKSVRWAVPWDELISAPLGVSQAAGRLGLNYPKAPSSCVSSWHRPSAESSAGAVACVTYGWLLSVACASSALWLDSKVSILRQGVRQKRVPFMI